MKVVADRLSLRWYLGYDLGDELLDHSSLTRIRERYGLDVFRRFFEAIVEQCIDAGLVWGRELYIDATKVEANASLDSVAPRFAVEAHLAELFTKPASPTQVDLEAATEPLPVNLPADALEELAEANAERHDWIEEEGRQNRSVAAPDYQRISDYKASRTDPDASLMQRRNGGSHFGYHTHYVVDGGRARIILQALVTPSEVMENQLALDLLWRARFRWKLWPYHITGDTTYGTIPNITAIERAGIHAYMPLPDCDSRTPFFGKLLFSYDPDRDVYTCPQGEPLHFQNYAYTYNAARYRADPAACNACELKPQCTTSRHGRTLRRSLDEVYIDKVRAYHETEAYEKAMRKRQLWVEPLFAEGKQWHGMGRFRLRRLRCVNIEALVIATGQNLKRLLSGRGWGRRHFPGSAAGVVLMSIEL